MVAGLGVAVPMVPTARSLVLHSQINSKECSAPKRQKKKTTQALQGSLGKACCVQGLYPALSACRPTRTDTA